MLGFTFLLNAVTRPPTPAPLSYAAYAANPAAAGKLNVPTAVCVKESSEQQSTACLETAADESLDTYSRHLNVDYKLESLISSSE